MKEASRAVAHIKLEYVVLPLALAYGGSLYLIADLRAAGSIEAWMASSFKGSMLPVGLATALFSSVMFTALAVNLWIGRGVAILIQGEKLKLRVWPFSTIALENLKSASLTTAAKASYVAPQIALVLKDGGTKLIPTRALKENLDEILHTLNKAARDSGGPPS